MSKPLRKMIDVPTLQAMVWLQNKENLQLRAQLEREQQQMKLAAVTNLEVE